jgi:hypothetical protein
MTDEPAQDRKTTPATPAAQGRESRRGRATVVVIFVLIAVLFVAQVPGVFLVNPDSTVYLGVARSLARGEGYTFNFKPYAKYPPVYPLMLAGVFATAGEDFRAMQTVTALTGVLALVAAYALVKARSGRWPALAVVLLTAMCSWFQSHASVYIRADVPYTMFSLAALWYAERWLRARNVSWARWAIVAMLTVLALYTHMVGVALVAGIAAGAVFAREWKHGLRRRLVAAAIIGAVGLAATGYWLYRGRDISNPMANYGKHAGALPKGQMGSEGTVTGRAALRLTEWLMTPLNMDDEKATAPLAVTAFAVLIVPGLFVGFGRYRSCMEFYLCAYFAISVLGGGPTGGPRYTLPMVPLLFYYGGVSLDVLGSVIGSFFGRRGRTWVPRVLVGVCAGMILAYATYVRVKADRGASKFEHERRERDRVRTAVWKRAAERVRQAVAETDDALVFPGSGNTWAKLHYFADVPMAEVRFQHVRERAMRAMLEQGADFVFDDVTNDHCRRRLDPLLREHGECFEKLAEFTEGENHLVLYRLDRAKLRAELAETESAARE